MTDYTQAKTDAGLTSRVLDPYGGFNFRVEIESIDAGAFREVDGIGVDVQPIEIQDGTDLMPRWRPGRKKVNEVRLRKGFIARNTLFKWMMEILKGKLRRKSISIVLLNDSGDPVLRYNFFEAWPKSWSGLHFDGNNQAAMVEEVTFVAERIDVDME